MAKNDESLVSKQKEASLKGEGRVKKSTGESFSFYLTVITQCIDLVLKLSPVFMLGAGLMLWSYLGEIGWTHLLVPTASSPSGLAFLAISALAFIGAAIVVFLTPSLFFSSGLDFYEDRLIPARMKWILVGLAVLWSMIFAAVGFIDGFSERFSVIWAVIALYLAGVVGYSLPGLIAASDACEKQSAQVKRKIKGVDDTEKIWRKIFAEHWLMLRPKGLKEGGAAGGVASAQGNIDSTVQKDSSNVPSKFDWMRPLGVVFMAMATAIATSWPVLVLIRLWGEQLERSIGYIPAFFIILFFGGMAVSPAYTYLSARSQDPSSITAARRASVAAAGLVLLSLFSMMYAPIRDRVFHLLEIQSSRKEYFLISSPVAQEGLRMLGFPLAVMPLSVLEWKGADASDKLVPGDSDEPNQRIKLNTSMIVQAWVGYSFGDTVLLCRWRVGDRGNGQLGAFHDRYSTNNACLPLTRTELRRLSNVWPDKN